MTPDPVLADVVPLIPQRNRYIYKLKRNSASDLDLFSFLQLETEYSAEELREAKKIILENCAQWFVSRNARYRWELLEVIDSLGMVELVPQLVGFYRWEQQPEDLRDKIGQVIVSLTRKLMKAAGGEGAMVEYCGIGDGEGESDLEEEHRRSLKTLRFNRLAYETQPRDWYQENEGRFAVFAEGRLRHLAGSTAEAVAWERENLLPEGLEVFTIQVRKPEK